MAARNWVMSICVAVGVAAGASLASLGLGYGLGGIAWASADTSEAWGGWYASLAWVTWLAATSTVLGALIANRVGPGIGRSTRSEHGAAPRVWAAVGLVAVALAAAIGAMITVPLVAIPARIAPLADNSAPHFTAAGYAIAGVIIGLLASIAAIAVPAVAANVGASSAYIWVMAIVAGAHSLGTAAGPGGPQLGTWRRTDEDPLGGMVDLPTALILVSVALLVGALAAWPAGRRGDSRVGVAVSGAAGPALVAAAYFLTTPGMADRSTQLSAYVIAPYAVLAGVAGSALVAAIGPAGARRRRAGRATSERAAPATAHAGGTDHHAWEPTPPQAESEPHARQPAAPRSTAPEFAGRAVVAPGRTAPDPNAAPTPPSTPPSTPPPAPEPAAAGRPRPGAGPAGDPETTDRLPG